MLISILLCLIINIKYFKKIVCVDATNNIILLSNIIFYFIIVASEASDLIFKIVIFHDVPQGPQIYTQGFSELVGGG